MDGRQRGGAFCKGSMAFLRFLVLVFVIDDALCQVPPRQRAMDDLIQHLLSKYNKYSPAVNNEVQVELALGNIIEVSTAAEFVEFRAWWRKYWTDPRLSWNETEWGISMVSIDASLIWIPDIKVYEAISEIGDRVGATIYPSGSVFRSVPTITKLSCPMVVRTFPFDRQRCNFTLGQF